MRSLQLPVRLNPLLASHEGVTCVLAGPSTLRWAISTKNLSNEVPIVAGPNICVLPSEMTTELASRRVGMILVPSAWVLDLWVRDLPEIAHKLRVWAAGVETSYWKPADDTGATRRPLIYTKVDWPGVKHEVTEHLSRSGIGFRELTYGTYSTKRFKDLLMKSNCVIYIGGSESQGLALAEAWSMDVPTFVFDPPHQEILLSDREPLRLARGDFRPAPYLTNETGGTWSSISELSALMAQQSSFAPRVHALRAWTDEHKAREFYELATSFNAI